MQPTHESGLWKNEQGLLYNDYQQYIQAYECAVLIDMDCGTLLKAGTADFIKTDLQRRIQAYRNIGMASMTKTYRVYEFSNFTNLSPDDICTILNYLYNHPSEEQVRELLEPTNLSVAKDRIQQLQQIGF